MSDWNAGTLAGGGGGLDGGGALSGTTPWSPSSLERRPTGSMTAPARRIAPKAAIVTQAQTGSPQCRRFHGDGRP